MKVIFPELDLVPHDSQMICREKSDVAFVGKSIDERGRHSVALATHNSSKVLACQYDHASFTLLVGDQPVRINELEEFCANTPAERVLIDATTLDFPELLLLCRAYLQSADLGFLYIEPEGYSEHVGPVYPRTFELSTRFQAFQAIPGFGPELHADRLAHLAACIGFESTRLRRLLAEDEGHFIDHLGMIFGIPPYQVNWEMQSLLHHADVIEDHGAHCEVLFAAANNPKSTYECLNKLYRALPQDGSRVLMLGAFGTKPTSIAVALFACTHGHTRVVYDFPTHRQDRTRGVGPVHYFMARVTA